MMINIINKKDCCGCHACQTICPLHCIDMVADQEGFLYPKINLQICCDCGSCEKVCPILCGQKTGGSPKAFAAWCKDKSIRADSSSGGVFSVLMKKILSQNGVVFGAAFDENMKLCHQSGEDESECLKFRGSKYLQSSIGDTYDKAKKNLHQERLVLFSGTPCQIAGLYTYLGRDYENLLTCDLVCHGVPSPSVFSAYKVFLEHKYKSKTKKISFRNKDYGWKKFSVSFIFENNVEYKQNLFCDPFMIGFLENNYLRPSCHDCRFSCIPRVADISLADYWGVSKHHQEWDDDKGTSLILAQTEKGGIAIDACRDELNIFETDLNVAISSNSCIVGSVLPGKLRALFFRDFGRIPFNKLVKKYMQRPSVMQKLIKKIRF